MRRLLDRIVALWLRLERWNARKQLDPNDPVDAYALDRLDGAVFTLERQAGLCYDMSREET